MVSGITGLQSGSVGVWVFVLTTVALLPMRGQAADDFSRWDVQPPVQGLPVDEPAADVRLAQAVIGQPPCPPPTSGPPLAPSVLQPDPVFTCSTLRGGTFQCFPSTLLWEPPLASKAEPRMALLFNTLDDATSQQTVDGYIRGHRGLVPPHPGREPLGRPARFLRPGGIAVFAVRLPGYVGLSRGPSDYLGVWSVAREDRLRTYQYPPGRRCDGADGSATHSLCQG